MNCAEFYEERDKRSKSYTRDAVFGIRPVRVVLGQAESSTVGGQVALLSLANMLARAHRQISFELPRADEPLNVWTPFGGRTLSEAVVRTVTSIDPCGKFSLESGERQDEISIAIGAVENLSAMWYIGATGALAKLGHDPIPVDGTPASVRGAAMSACLGAAAVFRSDLNLGTSPRELSAWNFKEGEQASLGPSDLVPTDVGKALIIGAGAVASALVYWLNVFGVAGSWSIVDRDVVKLHNTNRGLLFVPRHTAEWTGADASLKAGVLGAYLPAAAVEAAWYHESRLVQKSYDVILPLANEHGVRNRVANASHTVGLHASTGEDWLSELHRHIIGRDDCVGCRTADLKEPVFGCSGGEVTTESGVSTDAALPFLSAASGLMLALALQKLQCGELADGSGNDWRLDFGSQYKMASFGVRRCRDGCHTTLPPEVRRKVNAGGRWSHLDRLSASDG